MKVIVIGLGAMGSSALYNLSKRGIDVIGIDKFSPPHQFDLVMETLVCLEWLTKKELIMFRY